MHVRVEGPIRWQQAMLSVLNPPLSMCLSEVHAPLWPYQMDQQRQGPSTGHVDKRPTLPQTSSISTLVFVI